MIIGIVINKSTPKNENYLKISYHLNKIVPIFTYTKNRNVVKFRFLYKHYLGNEWLTLER